MIEKVIGILLALVLIVGMSFLIAFPVMWLWNSTMPELFGLKQIGLMMALRICLLCSFLFKGSSSSKE